MFCKFVNVTWNSSDELKLRPCWCFANSKSRRTTVRTDVFHAYRLIALDDTTAPQIMTCHKYLYDKI